MGLMEYLKNGIKVKSKSVLFGFDFDEKRDIAWAHNNGIGSEIQKLSSEAEEEQTRERKESEEDDDDDDDDDGGG